ncbi:FAD-dependent oxidoreductase [Chloracidobacterium validum]|uniref:FAD-dependent oxidoreductase n=2 Tax=Chloracidobacterium validum TaxID=2821543 RepID=A0ABX8B671_9BACT|nr:FAD-dependent oxidoreductase [Chloracidobacterium validum]
MDVAIIGAGLSGLTAAYTLVQRGFNCEVLEKSRALGGRMATRRYLDAVFDHGAQYFTVKHPSFADFLREVGVTDAMRPLAAPVVSYPFQNFDAALAEAVDEGTPGNGAFPYRYVFQSGMTTLAKAIVQRIGEDRIIRECFVEAIAWDGATRQWTLHTRGDNTTLGGTRQADWVILALPAPQAAQLLSRSHPLPAPFAALQLALEGIDYHPCLTIVWSTSAHGAYPGAGAFRATSGDAVIGWLMWLDRTTPHRLPAGQSVAVAQLTPKASRALLDQPEGMVLQTLASALDADLQMDLPTLQWVQVKQWRYANPATILTDQSCLAAVADFNLDACGDYLLGGRVESAFLTGLAVADRLSDRIGFQRQ